MKSSQTTTYFLLVASLFVTLGCGQGTPQVTSPVVTQAIATQQVVAPPAPTFVPPAPLPEDRESIVVDFVEVLKNDRDEFIVMKFTNATAKHVATIRGAVHVLDTAGNILRGYGYTDGLFNKAPGESVDLPLLKIKPDGPLAAQRDNLATFTYVYVANEITFANE